MSLKTMGESMLFNIKETAQAGFDKVKSIADSVVGKVSSAASGIFSGDVIGINVNEIPNMQTAIKNYVDALNQHLDEVKQNATTDSAFTGAYAGAVTEFVTAVKECCYAVISQLLAFSDKLADVKDQYDKRDKALASQIGEQSDEIKSSYTAYEAK